MHCQPCSVFKNRIQGSKLSCSGKCLPAKLSSQPCPCTFEANVYCILFSFFYFLFLQCCYNWTLETEEFINKKLIATHGFGSLRTWHWCLLGLWWRPQVGNKRKETSIAENLQPIPTSKALIHSWRFHPYHPNISTPHHSPLQHHCMGETVAHWSLAVDHIHRRALAFPYARRQLWTFSILLLKRRPVILLLSVGWTLHGSPCTWICSGLSPQSHWIQGWEKTTRNWIYPTMFSRVFCSVMLAVPQLWFNTHMCLVYQVAFPSASW